MKDSDKREIRGQVEKEWMESVEEKSVEEKRVTVVKREGTIAENVIHMSNPGSFTINGRTIRCSENWQSWVIDRELKSVCLCNRYLVIIYCLGSLSIVCTLLRF